MYTSEAVQATRSNDNQQGFNLTRLIQRLLENWWWFLLCMVLGLLFAFFYTKLTPPLYKINARVLVNDQEGGAGLGAKQSGAMMDLGGLIGGQSSVDNEAELLKTPDLIEEVVRQNKLNIVYHESRNFVNRELYRAPFELKILNPVDTIQLTQIGVEKQANDQILVTADDFEKSVKFGESFNIDGVGTLQLVRNPDLTMSEVPYTVEVSSVDERVTTLMEQLTVQVVSKQVTIIDLNFDYPVEKRGEEILTSIIENYKRSNLNDKNAIADSTYTFIRERLNVIASELGDVENKVEQFKQKNRLADMSEQGKLLVQTTYEFSSELAKAESQIAVLNDLEAYLKDETKNKRIFPASLLPSDLVFSSLMNQYNALLAERDKTLMSVTEATPFVQNLNSQITSLRKGILSNVQSTKNTFVINRDKLRSQLSQAQKQVQGVPQIEMNYLKLARNQQIKQELYIFLMQKAEETAISKTSNISAAKVIARPKAEIHPVSPKKKVVYIGSLLAGLMLPLLVIIVKSSLSSTISSRSDIEELTDVPILGEISHNLLADNLIVASHGRSAISEQFRALRSNLSFYLHKKDSKVLLLTSSMSGEGKSFTAINLAIVLSILGKKVLLMELDLRKPGLSNKLQLDNAVGFSNYIIDESLTAKDVVKPIPVNPNLSIISSGPLPPNPVELLMSDRTTELITELKQEYDYIIMDAPPIGILSDAQVLVDFADVTLYLVRQEFTQKSQLDIVNQLAHSGKINNLGIVVNDVSSKYYGYGYGYGNYDQEEKKSFFRSIAGIFKK
jgi:tyrosine-protein kinase Etk/Wzc